MSPNDASEFPLKNCPKIVSLAAREETPAAAAEDLSKEDDEDDDEDGAAVDAVSGGTRLSGLVVDVRRVV